MSQYIIQTRDLTKTYGEQKSVSNLNMHVRKGKIYGLLGRNGAGKTTTMKMLLNLICKLRSNGMPVPLLRNCYSIFNGTKYR